MCVCVCVCTSDEVLESELLKSDANECDVVSVEVGRYERDLLAAVAAERTAEPPHEVQHRPAPADHVLQAPALAARHRHRHRHLAVAAAAAAVADVDGPHAHVAHPLHQRGTALSHVLRFARAHSHACTQREKPVVALTNSGLPLIVIPDLGAK